MRFDIITIFPKIFDSYFNESILARAQKAKLISIHSHNLRDFSDDKKHHKVDAPPYGGGPGMVMQVGPIANAVTFAKKQTAKSKKVKTRVILFSTRGRKLTSLVAQRLAEYSQLILICGRYEGVDERVATAVADEEISLGDFVLSGGEIPAMALVDAVSRFIPGVLGKYESLEEVKGSYPVYTRPEEFLMKAKTSKGKPKKLKVPEELLNGNHAVIKAWRDSQGK